MVTGFPKPQGLYQPQYERDACGVGFLVNVNGEKSHLIIERGIQVLRNLLHRGAMGADLATGDGAGLLFQIPDRFFRRECEVLGMVLPEAGHYGVGMVFMPKTDSMNGNYRSLVEKVATGEGLAVLGWRRVPTDGRCLGDDARAGEPAVWQCFLSSKDLFGAALERKLYVVRKQIEKRVREDVDREQIFYVASLSCRTIVYKGLMTAKQITSFYADLGEPTVESALCVIHQRYSTNTFPSWELAQPFRYLAHNGEINTLRGNKNWMRSREGNLASDLFGQDIKKILPIIDEDSSDSGCLDNALELLVNGGRSLHHSAFMLIPGAWGYKYPMGPDMRGFFEYHAALMEPWDGPAAVAFSDGRYVGAVLDRNGLRPARYTMTRDGFVVFASEAGVLDIAPEEVEEKGSLRPGQMLLIDTSKHSIMHDTEIKMQLARRQPYRRWVNENKINVHGFYGAVSAIAPDSDKLAYRHRLFGYTREDINVILDSMASSGHEPSGSMGSDQPLAVLSEKPQLLYWYFKQIFAQITNPAMDPIREELVTSLMTFLGAPDNMMTEQPAHARLVKLRHPILANEDLERIRDLNLDDFRCHTIPIGFSVSPSGGHRLEKELEEICYEAEKHVLSGVRLVVLSDRNLPRGVVPIPALLAVSAVNSHLVREGLRANIAIIVETGEAREVMHLALLLGYGASAVNPWLAFETVAHMAMGNMLSETIGVAKALENYIGALTEGLLKIMSKIGISTLRSYRSAQVFEAIGLHSALVDTYFEGTASRIGGIGIEEIGDDAKQRLENAEAYNRQASVVLPSGGQYKLLLDGERHMWSPDTISHLQQACRNNDYKQYRKFAALINDQVAQQSTLRGLLRFKKQKSIPIDEVEPAADIVKRFVTGAMSFGSISPEMHETLAIAMNRIGGKSNSGEGGEDPARSIPLSDGDNRASATKQVASGRFGVTAEYLVNAKEIQIKIAQGAKPGEGGQLPGHKVNAEIAKVRYATPGVTLISPPPHHDIYSIEDIAQLIYDLKSANREARISVKLVSEVGVGTVAAGVAKARSDVILISGYDGGTGASPLSSIKHAGIPWELGLAETQQTLVLNGLRSRVRLQVDGQLRTGRDVVIGALLGAEEFGFATAVLVVCGCVMMRKCHLNVCPVGVATQDQELRKRFTGRAEHVIRYFHMVAEEVREHLAALGYRKMDDIIGKSELLENNPNASLWKKRKLDFSKILYRPKANTDQLRQTESQEHGMDQALDLKILPKVQAAIDGGQKTVLDLPIRNINRAVGTIVSSEIARQYGGKGLPDDTITLRFKGAAGQSFGAFCASGMTLVLEGEANDYVGKGLSGGKIILKPDPGTDFDAASNIIAGNVLLYGATSGEMYINGRVGERFAIRNSGVIAVVEGVGDHGCEYMTRGRVVVIGPTGVNFGAGMSGGIAYVYDETGMFDNNCNLEMIDLELITEKADEEEIRTLLEAHVACTDSKKAREILENWDVCLAHFIKVFPMEYKRVLGKMSREDADTEREEVLDA
jgi:glutamate synthase domain-containing protein 2/glutamate synthase domain-containing protein 1/glutamate synthase domain-containing protein 3